VGAERIIFVALAANGKSFTAGLVTEVDWKIKGGQVVFGVMVEITQVYRDLTGF
jgi:hypothetical protein